MKKNLILFISLLVFSVKANTFTLYPSAGLNTDGQTFEDSFSIDTNPFSYDITIRLKTFMDSEVKVSLTDELGKRILHSYFENRATTKTLNTSQLPQGTYFIKIESGKNSFVTKIVKE